MPTSYCLKGHVGCRLEFRVSVLKALLTHHSWYVLQQDGVSSSASVVKPENALVAYFMVLLTTMCEMSFPNVSNYEVTVSYMKLYEEGKVEQWSHPPFATQG